MTTRLRLAAGATLAASLCFSLLSVQALAQGAKKGDARSEVIEHWTKERKAAAMPRDLLIDPRGLGYLRGADGKRVPHGHDIAALDDAPESKAGKPTAGATGDKTPPSISGMDPAAGATIGASYTFKATVTDTSGVKSVTFRLQKGTGTVQSFAGTKGAGNVWSVALQGFTAGSDWQWWIEARDTTKSGNTAVSGKVAFKVDTGGGGGGGAGGVENDAEWTFDGVVQMAAGRLYFEMPANSKRARWAGYVCSGTLVNDGLETTDRSIILTAAHCVYDDAYKAFARKVMFIPDQADTSGSGTDLNCSNDPIGCWVPSIGAVDTNWTTRTFPNNVAWDYAFYVVRNAGMHQGTVSPDALESAVVPMTIKFDAPAVNAAGSGDFTHALGYSYDVDPQLRYCAEDMTTEGAANWWLPSCDLSGGSSGGPWVQPMDVPNGNGPIISVNSWGYTNQSGMAGPKLSGTSARCVFSVAKAASLAGPWSDGSAGVIWAGGTSCP